MKTMTRLTAAITLVMLLTGVSHAQQASTLLTDGFEEGTAAPEGWKKGAAIQGVKYYYDKRLAKTGSRSLSLQKSANRYFPIAQWSRTVPLDGDVRAIKVTSQVRARKATKAIVDVMFLDSSGDVTSHKWASYIGAKEANDPPADHDWKEYSADVVIPAGTKKIMLGLQIYGPGKVWFDDLEVKSVETGAAQ